MKRMRTVVYTTKRPPVKVGGKQAAPAAYLTDPTLRCTPLDPADGATARAVREQLGRDVGLLETYVDDRDIREGDVLVVAGREFPVRRVESWVWRGGRFLRLIVEEV